MRGGRDLALVGPAVTNDGFIDVDEVPATRAEGCEEVLVLGAEVRLDVVVLIQLEFARAMLAGGFITNPRLVGVRLSFLDDSGHGSVSFLPSGRRYNVHLSNGRPLDFWNKFSTDRLKCQVREFFIAP